MTKSAFRVVLVFLGFSVLVACSPAADDGLLSSVPLEPYGAVTDGDITIPPVDRTYLQEPNRRADVVYYGPEEAGTIVVDPFAKFLYYVEEGGQATRYPIAVGREGRGFRGRATVQQKREWPGWTPTANMLRTEPEIYGPFRGGIPGGVASPLGARALYLYRGGRDTRYRIHGTNDLSSIGNATTAGCIRLFNQDVIHLSERTPLGARVVVRTYEELVAAEGEQMANRGDVLPPTIVDPTAVYAAVEAEEARRAQSE